jgi:hypothetical protein
MKRTDKKQITLKLDDLTQLEKQACLEDRMPLFHVEIQDKRYVMLTEDDAMELGLV